MIKANYEELVKRIAELAKVSVDEIKKRVEEKRARLSGLISAEGAAQLVAAELGVSFENQRFKIAQLLIGMKKVNVVGKVIEVYPIKKYIRGGQENEIASFLLADETASIKVIVWDTNIIEKIKSKEIKENCVVEIKNADVRGTTAKELHLGSRASIELSNEKIENVVLEEFLPEKKLCDVNAGERINVRAFVVQAFQPAFFSVCPECGLRISYENDKAVCVKHGTVMPEKRALLSMIIDDGTDNLRAIAFHDVICKILKISKEDILKLQESDFWLDKKSELLGTEMIFSGRVRKNVLFDRLEFVIENAKEVDVEKLIEELSKNL